MSMNQDETPARPDYPPPPGNEYPRNEYPQYPALPPTTRQGFDLQDLIARWRSVLYPPSVGAFDAQKPAANWNAIWINLALLGVVQAVFGFVTALEFHRQGTAAPGFGTIIGNFLGAFIGFFIGAGLIYLVARMLGGTGTFLEHAWLLSLVYVPIQAIASIVGIIPVLGGIVGALLGLYSIVLYIYATASAHRMSLGRSAAAVLIPGAVLFVLALIVIAVAAAFLIGLGLAVPGR